MDDDVGSYARHADDNANFQTGQSRWGGWERLLQGGIHKFGCVRQGWRH